MKGFLLTLAAVVAGLVVWSIWQSRRMSRPGMLPQSARDAGNAAALSTYQHIPPIAQLAKPPWANVIMRRIDPVIPPPIAPTVIPQNGTFS